jgi:hypothetical protein
MYKNHATKSPHSTEKLAGHRKCVKKNCVTKCPHVTKKAVGHHKWVNKCCDNRPNFTSGKCGHNVTEHFEEGGCYVTCDKPSTLKPGWMKNMWRNHIGGRMSQ